MGIGYFILFDLGKVVAAAFLVREIRRRRDNGKNFLFR